MRFRDFEDTAREMFGLDAGETRDLADALDAAGFNYRQWDADDPLVWEIASDILDFEDVDEAPYEPVERWPLDPRFRDDEYLDADVEWELTVESERTP